MKSYRKELWFVIPSRRGFSSITPDVEVALLNRVGLNPMPKQKAIRTEIEFLDAGWKNS